MNGIAKTDNQQRPARSKAETKAEITDSVARTIIEAEAKARDTKTAKIRQARLAMEARAAEAAPSRSRGKKTSKRLPETAN